MTKTNPSLLLQPALGLCLLLFTLTVYGKPSAAPVFISTVKNAQYSQQLQLSGTVNSAQTSKLAAEVNGLVMKRFFEVGDQVQQGDLLLSLRDIPSQLLVEAAQAGVAQAQATVQLAGIDEQRLANLIKSRSTSAESYDAAKAKLAQSQAGLAAAKAELARLEDQLQRHHIHAPFTAVISARHAEVGDWLESGSLVCEISAQQALHVALPVPQQYFSSLSVKDEVSIRIAGITIVSQIKRIIPWVNGKTRTFTVWLALDNSQNLFVPGMSAQVKILLNGKLNNRDLGDLLAAVPRDAIIRKANGKTFVWRVSQSAINNDENNSTEYSVEQLRVEELGSHQGWATLKAGSLKEGDWVVVRGNETLRQGQAVILQQAPGAEPKSAVDTTDRTD